MRFFMIATVSPMNINSWISSLLGLDAKLQLILCTEFTGYSFCFS